VVTELERLTGVKNRRIHVDKGNCGHNHSERFRVWVTGQARCVAALRYEMKLRAAVEPVIIGQVTHRKLTVARQYRTRRDCAIASICRRRSASSGTGWRDF